MSNYIGLLIAAIISNSVLIGIINKHRQGTLSNISFILFLALINVWAIPQLVINLTSANKAYFETLDKISAFGYGFIPVVFLIFALSFTNRLSLLNNYLFTLAIFLPAVVFLFLSWSSNLIDNHHPDNVINAYWGYASPPGPLFSIFLFWFELLMIISLLLIIKTFKTTVDIFKKKQALWLTIAILIPLSLGSVTDGLLPIAGITLLPSAIPLTSVMALVIGYAIFKYELFELSHDTVLSSMHEGVISLNNKGQIIMINPSAENMLGLKSQEIVAKPVFKEIPLRLEDGQPVPEERKPLLLAWKSGKTYSNRDFCLERSNKTRFPASISVSPVFYENKVTGAIVTFRDITNEKELEKRKNEFISIASHELKTPITTIKGYTEILKQRLLKKKDSQLIQYIDKINNQIDRLSNIITDLLDVSKIQSGKLKLQKEPVEINSLVSEIVEDMQKINSSHKIIIQKFPKKMILIDKYRISQVLINLISNAIKYSPKGQKVIISAKSQKDNIKLSVKDFGIGISSQDQSKIFERFFQTSPLSQPSFSGLGLGLYISSQIVKQHGGKISVESKINKGSKFTFSLARNKI